MPNRAKSDFNADDLADEILRDFDKTIRTAGEAGLETARATAPVRTGALRAGLALEKVKPAHYQLTANVHYAKYQWYRFRARTAEAIRGSLDRSGG